MIPVGQLALRYAKGEIGVKENPPNSNDGTRIRDYRKSGNRGAIVPPESWCADFVAWCFERAGARLPGWYLPRAENWILYATPTWGLDRVAWPNVQSGDIVVFDWDDNGVGDHIGIVARKTSASTFESVEGNTSPTSDSNGGAVMLRSRSLSDVFGFSRMRGQVHDPEEFIVPDPKPPAPVPPGTYKCSPDTWEETNGPTQAIKLRARAIAENFGPVLAEHDRAAATRMVDAVLEIATTAQYVQNVLDKSND